MGYFDSHNATNPVYRLGFIAFPVVLQDTTNMELEDIHINVVLQHRFLVDDILVDDEDFHHFLAGSVDDDEWILNKPDILKRIGCIDEIKKRFTYDEAIVCLKNFYNYVISEVPTEYEYLAGRLSIFMWFNDMEYSERMIPYVADEDSALNDRKVSTNLKVFKTLSEEMSGDQLFNAVDRYISLPSEYVQHMLDAYTEGLTFTDAIQGITR